MGQLHIPHAWHVGVISCPASLTGMEQGSHGTVHVKVL